MKFSFSIFFFLLILFGFTQNLVPNPSFELFDSCPTTTNQVNMATGWSIDINSSDYFNSCAISSSTIDVPSTFAGYRCPANGNAFCGFAALRTIQQEYREYLGRSLSQPLTIGQKYYISFKLSLAYNISSCAVNKVGVKFTNVNYGDTTILPTPYPVMNNTASFFSDNIITDTSWSTFFGTYVADSSYQYILIGNFFDNYNTDTTYLWGSWCQSYYFIDDICVSIDSLTCVIPNGINACNTGEINSEELFENFVLFPNPATDKITIYQNEIQKIVISIYNIFGKCLFQNSYLQKEIEIDLTTYPSGIYYMLFDKSNNVSSKKISIIR